MLDVCGVQVKPVTTTMLTTVVVLVVEHENQLTEVDGDHRAPQDRGPRSRRGPRRRLQSEIFVVDLLPGASAPGTFVPMGKLVHTAVLSGT